jgi:N-acetyl-alpha-D-glucosaminyl L-malate synthase BshA
MSLRVLVVSHMYPNPVNPMSGIFVHNQVKALLAAGVEVRVVVPVPSLPLYPKWKGYRGLRGEHVRDGVKVRYVPTRMFPGGLFFGLYGHLYHRALKDAVAEIRKEFPFDLIHCHTIYPDGFAGGLLKRDFGVPVVSTVHGSDILLYPKRGRSVWQSTKQALAWSDHVITVSDRLKREAEAMEPNVKVTTVYNGFAPDTFYPREKAEARAALGLEAGGKILLYVGNLLPVKGVHFLLEAFQRVSRKDESLRLVLVGDGPLRSSLEKRVEELGLGGKVHFVGRRPHEEIPVWLGAADAVVLTSLSEGLPSILLESMGAGRPMVATDVGGIREVLQDGVTGFLAPARDVEAIGDRLESLLLDDARLKAMGTAALEASARFTWEANARKTKECYEQILERKTL